MSWKDNDKIKIGLALVSVWVRGQCKTIVVKVRYSNGVPRFHESDYAQMSRLSGVVPGEPFAFKA